MPMPASSRNNPNCQTFVARAAAPVNTAYAKTVAAKTRVRPKRSATGPQINESPQPTRNKANKIDPARPTFSGVLAMPDLGSSSESAGLKTSAYIKESMPSRVQPDHAAQNPVICADVSLVCGMHFATQPSVEITQLEECRRLILPLITRRRRDTRLSSFLLA